MPSQYLVLVLDLQQPLAALSDRPRFALTVAGNFAESHLYTHPDHSTILEV
jgi:hypothetical protein